MISVLVLTKNESRNIARCLTSVASWCDDIHVLDSMSTDGTDAIATSYGAHLTLRQFTNWADHQNWALAHIPFRHPWVLYLDADETCTPELKQAIGEAVSNPGSFVAFHIERRDMMYGRWLKHTQMTTYYQRLFRADSMRYERLVNPVSRPAGPVGSVHGHIQHFPFSKGVGDWLRRHNDYSTLEAEQSLGERRQPVSLWQLLTTGKTREGRAVAKAMFYKLPCRPAIRFLFLYLWKRGFLDGYAGLAYASLQAFYEFMIVLKSRELAESADSHEPQSRGIKNNWAAVRD